jgi:uncharacterized protein (DUF2147 family)
MRRLIAAVLASAAIGLTFGVWAQEPQQQILGRWLSESRRGVIDIYRCEDKLCGKLVWMIEPMRNGAPALDRNNPTAELRKRPLCGVMMLGDFRRLEERRWGDGWIYDPDSGKTYSATMSLESPSVLKLRGYVGVPLFGETQTWTRPDASYGAC